jgi:hypothetical protein
VTEEANDIARDKCENVSKLVGRAHGRECAYSGVSDLGAQLHMRTCPGCGGS